MNLFKNPFRKSSSTTSLHAASHPNSSLYSSLSQWDHQRAGTLSLHLRIVREIIDSLDSKFQQSNAYVAEVHRVMTSRIKQLQACVNKGINSSGVIVQAPKGESYKSSYSLLKQLMIEQAQIQADEASKVVIMSKILGKLTQIIENNCPSIQSPAEIKSNILYLLDCELPDLIEPVLSCISAITQAYHSSTPQQDLWLLSNKFMHFATLQTEKHRQIGKQLIKIVEEAKRRQRKIRQIVRNCLRQWMEVQRESDIFAEQLKKKGGQTAIDDFYDIDDLIINEYDFGANASLSSFLQQFHIPQFTSYCNLLLFSRNGIYNNHIECKLVLTQGGYLHIFRNNAVDPDFSFIMNSSTSIQTVGNLGVKVIQQHKNIWKKQIQFQFQVEFNLEDDVRQMIKIALKYVKSKGSNNQKQKQKQNERKEREKTVKLAERK